ncbi:hypothetical protein D8O27_29910 [Burkholderia mallei]|uniref:Uncharacterized protein n=1 Tax=Burkholderia mallei TaxID=13373 RepID=A0AAX1X554_BURML|nr:ompA family protein [Burkholderia mallei]KOS94562.1 ompA family protein [Burkholderia mallei]KOT02564.1 ompA family protein [Burkholderia mallei]KOT11538.1 ompA family protein [Burkholderia mallei]KOT20477.1 ompA family protein [Burkholderia mallei]
MNIRMLLPRFGGRTMLVTSTADRRPPTADHRLPITDYRSRPRERRPPNLPGQTKRPRVSAAVRLLTNPTFL